MFESCSRTFSSSALHVTTSWEISTSFALDPIVLNSRAISWLMNSSVRPTGSFLRRVCANWAKWLSSRVNSRKPGGLAPTVTWLCSREADWMQAQTLYLDGGIFLHAPGHSVRWWRKTGRLS